MSADEVARRWSAEGPTWLEGLGRRDLSAVVAALGDPTVAARLTTSPRFAATLLPRLSVRRAIVALGRMWFLTPPRQHLRDELASVRSRLPSAHVPRWWKAADPGDHALVKAIAERTTAVGWTEAARALELPDVVPHGPWAIEIVRCARVDGVPAASHLVAFADGGRTRLGASVLSDCAREVVKRTVAHGAANGHARMAIAALLRQRVGDVFGGAANAYWHGLVDERASVRAWLAARILDVLFRHLVPTTDGAHQTEPRRAFWIQYTHRVEQIWLLVHPRLRGRLDRPEVKQELGRAGDMVELRILEGQVQQAVVWMHLRTDHRGVLTVIEGNASTRCRMRPGAHRPPERDVVNYSHDVVRGTVGDQHPDGATLVHHGNWQASARRQLFSFGVRP